jgi:predicted RNA polymerase sigma factor
MLLHESRRAARTAANGDIVLLADQDRARWDPLLIRRGLAALDKARSLGGERGLYALQAAIAACHARARRTEDTDWHRIAALSATLQEVAPSPVIELNRAVAVAMALGPAAGLAIVDRLAAEPALRRYQWLPSGRGDLLQKLGRDAEARAAFLAAAELAGNGRERELLLARAMALR